MARASCCHPEQSEQRERSRRISDSFASAKSVPEFVMTAQFITVVTKAGERWDTLAWRYYGDATLFGPIIQTNPQISIEAVFEAGLTIGVPMLMVNQAVNEEADLPPWKEQS
jgi:phage tail protein X